MSHTLSLSIPSQQIADQFVTAIEGGSNYWCRSFKLLSPGDIAWDDPADKGPWYANPRRYEDPDLKIEVTEDEAEDGEGVHIIGQAEIAKGLAIMAEKYPHHFADMKAETGDAITGDVFLQCVALGEVVYG
jgi:hypothetical protein